MDFFVRQFCTSDVENFGDVLYPILLEKILDEWCSTARLERFAFITGDAPLGAGYLNVSINNLFERNINSMPLIIGGGDIIRIDDLTVASHYRSYFSGFIGRQKKAEPILIGNNKGVRYYYTPPCELIDTAWFKRSLMPPCEFSFILSPDICPGASSVAYLSVGVPFDIEYKYCSFIRAAFDNSKYIYVRDYQSKEKLLKVGVEKGIVVAPDIAILVSRYFPKNRFYDLKSEILISIGLGGDENYLCFQINKSEINNIHQIAQSLLTISRRYKLKIVLLPLGPCHGDDVALQAIFNLIPHNASIVKSNNIWHMLALISNSSLFVGSSLHGNIVAYSYGIPHLFTPLDVDKITGVIDILRIPAWRRLKNWDILLSGMSSFFESEKLTKISYNNCIEAQEKSLISTYALLDSLYAEDNR